LKVRRWRRRKARVAEVDIVGNIDICRDYGGTGRNPHRGDYIAFAIDRGVVVGTAIADMIVLFVDDPHQGIIGRGRAVVAVPYRVRQAVELRS